MPDCSVVLTVTSPSLGNPVSGTVNVTAGDRLGMGSDHRSAVPPPGRTSETVHTAGVEVISVNPSLRVPLAYDADTVPVHGTSSMRNTTPPPVSAPPDAVVPYRYASDPRSSAASGPWPS